MQELERRIQYLRHELAARNRQDGWVIQGLKVELERLEAKAKKQAIKK
jgi:hypothetical protein